MVLLVGHPLLSHVLLERGEKKKLMRVFQLAGVTLLCLSIVFGIMDQHTKDMSAYSDFLKNMVFIHRLSNYLLIGGFLLYMISLHFSVDYLCTITGKEEDMRIRYLMSMVFSSFAILMAYWLPPTFIMQSIACLLPALAVCQFVFLTVNLSLYPGKRMFYLALVTAPILYAVLWFVDEAFVRPYALGITVAISCIMLLGAHYVENNGFFVTKRNWWERQEVEELAIRKHHIKKGLSICLSFPFKMASYARDAVSRQRTPYRSLSLYFFLIALLGFHLLPVSKQSDYINLSYIFFALNMILTIIALLHPFWPRVFAPYFALYWHFFLMCYLVILPTVLYFFSSCDVIALVNFILAIILLARFVNPMSFSFIHTLGLAISFLIMRYLANDVWTSFLSQPKTLYNFTYSYLIARLVGTLFIRKNKRELGETREKLKALVKKSIAIVSNALNITQSHASIINLCINSMEVNEEPDSIEKKPSVHITMEQSSYETMKENLDELLKSTTTSRSQLKRVFLPVNAVIKQNEFSDYHASPCVKEAVDTFVKDYEVQKVPKIHIEDDFIFKGSDQVLVAVLIQILRNAHECSHRKGEISIHIKNCKIYITNDESVVPKADLPHIFNEFFTHSSNNLGLGLFFAKQVMEAFGGEIYLIPTSKKNTTCIVLSF